MRRLALWLSLMLAPLAAPTQTFAQSEAEVRLKVLSFNIWYGGDQVSFAKVIEAIRLADADVVGLQEPDGRTAEIAAAAGYPYVDVRRHILSRYPLFDSGMGETQATEAPPYSTAGLDPDAVHVWAEVAPGRACRAGGWGRPRAAAAPPGLRWGGRSGLRRRGSSR